MSAILTVAVIAAAIIGGVVGFFKKFTKSSFWGITVLLTLLLVRAIGAGVKKQSGSYGITLLISTIVVLLAFTLIFAILKKLLKTAVEARKRMSHYKNYDDLEENRERILNALDSDDRGEYRRQIRNGKRIKDSAGIWGWLDRGFGAASGCLNALVGTSAVVLCMLLFADMCGIGLVTLMFEKALSSSSWKGLGSGIAFDLPLVCVLSLSIRLGYKGGFSSLLCTFILIGMICGFGAAAWSIASSSACAGAVEGLKNGLLGSFAGQLGGAADTVAKAILAVILFLLSLVVIIIVAIFLPKLVEKFRDGKLFCVVDGVFGAIFFCIVTAGLLMTFGGIAYTLNDLAFMERINYYADFARLGDALYSCNPLAGLFKALPIRGWFGNMS